MRIALVAPLVTVIREPHLGGSQAVVVDLAQALAARGHDVSLYAARGSAVDGVTVVPIDVDLAAVAADLVRGGVERAASAAITAAYGRVYEHAAARPYDVVHSHGFDAPAAAQASIRGVSVLHTLHLPPSRGIATALEAARSVVPTWCAAVSEAHAAAWRSLMPVDAVLRNGVPVDAIPFGERGGALAVIAARFSPEKGIAEGVEAARAAGLDVDVYGMPYDEAYETMVRARWATDGGVRFHEPLDRPNLWRVFASAAVVVCLSQWEEPFGMVAAEAQAAGTPVLATARGGLVEVVRDGVTGALVRTMDRETVAGAFAAVVDVRRAACREHAVRELSLDGSVAAHETLYGLLAGT